MRWVSAGSRSPGGGRNSSRSTTENIAALRPEQQSIDDREHRRIRADAEPKCKHHRKRETGLGAQAAQCVREILHEMFDEADTACLSNLLLSPLDAAECSERGRARIGRRHPRGDVLRGLPLDVKAQFVVELALHGGAPDECAQPVQQIAQQIAQHVGLPFRSSLGRARWRR